MAGGVGASAEAELSCGLWVEETLRVARKRLQLNAEDGQRSSEVGPPLSPTPQRLSRLGHLSPSLLSSPLITDPLCPSPPPSLSDPLRCSLWPGAVAPFPPLLLPLLDLLRLLHRLLRWCSLSPSLRSSLLPLPNDPRSERGWVE